MEGVKVSKFMNLIQINDNSHQDLALLDEGIELSLYNCSIAWVKSSI